jgi:hypothetical protein
MSLSNEDDNDIDVFDYDSYGDHQSLNFASSVVMLED